MLGWIVTSRDDKPRGIDFKEMEAALKRAAYKAVHGTREECSGRFLPETPLNAVTTGLNESEALDPGRQKR
jgi:hypothetical protein